MANKGVPTAAARRLIRERGDEIAKRYDDGESYASIAEDLGISRSAAILAVRRFGGTPRPRTFYSRPQMVARSTQVRERYEAGESLRAIAADLGVSFTTARADLLAAGGQTRSKAGTRLYQSGARNHRWKGGAHETPAGYRAVWLDDDDPMVGMRPARSSYVLEHRLVMARHLGRPLLGSETVHHVNGDKTDNRIENLQLRSAAHGPGVRFQCHDCGSQNVGAVAL